MTALEWLPTSRLSGSRLSVHHLHVKRFSSAPQRLIQHLPIVSRNVYHQQNVWTTAVTAGRFAISPPVTPLLPRSQSRGDNRDYAAAVVYWCGKAHMFDYGLATIGTRARRDVMQSCRFCNFTGELKKMLLRYLMPYSQRSHCNNAGEGYVIPGR